MKILVLMGGSSNERDVSLRSGEAVINSLLRLGYKVEVYDPIKSFDGIRRFKNKIDLVFPILHGQQGEDGTVQAYLEENGFKYLGSSSKVSAACFNKARFKGQLEELRLLTPKYEVTNPERIKTSELIQSPFVIKPIQGGSSLDLFIVKNPSSMPRALYTTLNKYKTMLLEELIYGTEITVPVHGSNVLPVVEIIPPTDGVFDFENKYNGLTQELCPPENLSIELQQQAQSIALTIHNQFGLRHLSRTDMIVASDGKIYVLETNIMPGMTEQSLLPKSALTAGLTMDELVDTLVKLALH